MNDDTIADLKQFIAATVTQEVSGLREDITDLRQEVSGLREDVTRLDTKIDNLAASVAEALENATESTDSQLQDHEHRIKLLEQKATA